RALSALFFFGRSVLRPGCLFLPTRRSSDLTRFCSARNRVERMPPVRIVLVEDNEVFRDALELLLGMRTDVEIVASVGDGVAAVRSKSTRLNSSHQITSYAVSCLKKKNLTHR